MSTYDCAETYARLQDYLDRELSPEEMQLVEAHLSRCGVCADEYKFEALVLRHIERAAASDMPSELLTRIHNALQQAEA